MKAIIMAGGEGTRLRPLTCDVPKPMLKIMNAPIMEHCIRLLKEYQITDIAVAQGYRSGKIREYFGNGRALGVNLSYFEEKAPLGTAGGVKNAAEFVNGEDGFLVISGGIITDINLAALIKFHREHNALATLALTRAAQPPEYGAVFLAPDGKIERFVENPDWNAAATAFTSAGAYVMSPKILSFIPESTPTDFERDVFPALLGEKSGIYGMKTKGYWCDIGNLGDYRRCHAEILDRTAKINMPPQVEEGIWLEQGAEVEQGAIVRPPVLIGSRCHIKRGARIEPYSVLGRGVTVEAGAGIKRSVVLDKCRIEENAQLRGAIADEGAVMARGSAVYEQAVIGRGSVVGENCSVKPSVKIWPQKELPPDSIQKTNLIWGNVGGGRIWTKTGLLGELGTEITPEAAARLGAAMGTLPFVKKLAASDSGSPAAAMLKSAFVGGALSTGVKLYDFGEQPLPVSRSGIKFYRMDAGVSINVFSKGGTDYGEIHVLAQNGIDPDRELMSALKSSCEREDFSRSGGDCINEAEYQFEYKLFYLKNLINSTKKQSLGYKLVIGSESEWAKSLIKSAGNDLNCHVETLDIADAEKVSFRVVEGGADLGALTDPSCQELTLVDANGKIIGRDTYTLLTAMIIAESYENARLYVPVSAPSGVELLAEAHGATVIRTKNAPPELMRELSDGGEVMLRDQFIYSFDAVGALIKLMDFMKTENASLAELVGRLPETHMVHTSVDCANRAEAMQRLYELHREQSPDLTDGIKLSFDNGWALIIPSDSSPAIDVVSQGYCEEYARELADMCVNEILS